MRLFLAVVLAFAALAATGIQPDSHAPLLATGPVLAWAEEDDTADPPPSDEGADSQGEEKKEEPDQGPRRRRPRTAEQEREYQRIKTRDDPFLTAPPVTGPLKEAGEFYNPLDWLRFDVHDHVSRYMVQDQTGAVVGYLTFQVSLKQDPTLGDFIYLAYYANYGDPFTTELWLYADTLKPRKLLRTWLPEKVAPAVNPGAGLAPEQGWDTAMHSTDQRMLAVDYLFDRVTVVYQNGGATTIQTMRQLPYAFDRDSLPLLMSQLNFRQPDWPFEAPVTDPLSQSNLPLYIDKPERQDIINASAEPVRCYALTGTLGGEPQTWWVERIPPHRLVKYVSGGNTFTLFEYTGD